MGIWDSWGFLRILRDSLGGDWWSSDSSLALMRHSLSRLSRNRYVVTTLPNRSKLFFHLNCDAAEFCEILQDSSGFFRIARLSPIIKQVTWVVRIQNLHIWKFNIWYQNTMNKSRFQFQGAEMNFKFQNSNISCIQFNPIGTWMNKSSH